MQSGGCHRTAGSVLPKAGSVDSRREEEYRWMMSKGRIPILEEIREDLRPFFEQTGAVVKAIVFGSYARGTRDAKSDLDILLVMETKERFLKRYDAIAGLYARIPRMEAEVLIYTPEELERNAERPFIQKALQEGKLIYERGKEQG